jgi:carboxymethylenebutenolidase
MPTQPNNVAGQLFTPAGAGPFPALVVIQEWWGLDTQTLRIAERFAGEGYLTFTPDLYEGEFAKLGDNETAMMLVQRYAPLSPAKLEVVYDMLKAHPKCSGKVGSVGFCFGGRMSLELGLRRPVDAVCTFYGGGMQQLFDRMNTFKAPVLGLFGDADQSIPVGTVEQFDTLLDTIGVEHEVIVYPDSGHAFFRDSDPNVYKPEAAKDAWERVKTFFGKHLK